jgi:hypothetical protein
MNTWPTNDNFVVRGFGRDVHVICARCDYYSEVFCLPRGRFEMIRVAMEAHDSAHEVIGRARRGEAVSAADLEGLVDDFEPTGPA